MLRWTDEEIRVATLAIAFFSTALNRHRVKAEPVPRQKRAKAYWIVR